jgi:hypothetical protein
MLAVIETHPVQYHAPVYAYLQQHCGIQVTAIYGSDFSLQGYYDVEFGTKFAWDVDLVSGYDVQFLSHAAADTSNGDRVSTKGLAARLRALKPKVVLLIGYSPAFYRSAIVTALQRRVPLLFRGETTDHAVDRGWLRRILRSIALKAFYSRCSKLLYIGEQSRRHFERLGVDKSKLVFSPYCINTKSFRVDVVSRDALRANTRAKLELTDEILLLF